MRRLTVGEINTISNEKYFAIVATKGKSAVDALMHAKNLLFWINPPKD